MGYVIIFPGELVHSHNSFALETSHSEAFTMDTLDSPKMPEHDRAPIMEHFKQSGSTRQLNTQPSLPMLGAGGKQHSQDTLQWEPTPEPSGNYVSNDQHTQHTQPLSNDVDRSNSSTFSKLASLVCCCRR